MVRSVVRGVRERFSAQGAFGGPRHTRHQWRHSGLLALVGAVADGTYQKLAACDSLRYHCACLAKLLCHRRKRNTRLHQHQRLSSGSHAAARVQSFGREVIGTGGRCFRTGARCTSGIGGMVRGMGGASAVQSRPVAGALAVVGAA